MVPSDRSTDPERNEVTEREGRVREGRGGEGGLQFVAEREMISRHSVTAKPQMRFGGGRELDRGGGIRSRAVIGASD